MIYRRGFSTKKSSLFSITTRPLKKRNADMMPILIIQHIHIIWTKNSKGMLGAAKRNAVPKTLRLPETQALQSVIVHEVTVTETPIEHQKTAPLLLGQKETPKCL